MASNNNNKLAIHGTLIMALPTERDNKMRIHCYEIERHPLGRIMKVVEPDHPPMYAVHTWGVDFSNDVVAKATTNQKKYTITRVPTLLEARAMIETYEHFKDRITKAA